MNAMTREAPLRQLDDKKIRLGRALQNLLLFFVGALAILLAGVSGLQIGGVSLLAGLPPMLIYYATLRHRRTTHPLAIFAIGLFQDLLSGGAIGLWACLYLVLYTMLLTQPRGLLHFIQRSALFSWLGFLLASFLFALLCWLVGWLILASPLSPLGLALQWFVAALLYAIPLLRRLRQPPPHPAAQPGA